MPFEQPPKFEAPLEAKEEKEGPTPEEKAEAIKGYIGAEDTEFTFPVKEEEREAMKKFFLELNPNALETTMGKRESDLVYGVISEYNAFRQHLAENNLREEDLQQFINEKGYAMVPCRIRESWAEMSAFPEIDISVLLSQQWKISEGESSEFPKLLKEHIVQELESVLSILGAENKEWQKYGQFEREKEEKPMEIKGFEKFDFRRIKGKEIVEIAAQILPRQLLSANVGQIEYQDKARPVEKEYGFSGKSFASFGLNLKEGGGDITFYKLTKRDKISYLRELPSVLAHEWGHSIDPRLVDQRDLPPEVQLQMIQEWEKARESEPEWSSYVMKINNPNKQAEEILKSQESLAESCAAFLEDPERFRLFHPERYSFFAIWLGARFPEFDFEDREKQKERHRAMYNFLPKIYGVYE